MKTPETKPLLSVVVPIFDKRVEEEDCLESWARNQTLSRESYEVIVTSNGADPDADRRVSEYLDSPDRLVEVPGANMAGLYHAGAVASNAPIFFFTELHCIGDPDCLEKLLDFLESNNCAGACTDSYGDHSNAFSSAEATLFEEMFDKWKDGGTENKILLRGVAIRRDPYFSAGGFVERYRRFCDGLLGARLADQGYEISYCPEARLLHYYSTCFQQLYEPVTEKTFDECLFQFENPPEFTLRHWGIHPDWSRRQSFNPTRARRSFHYLFRSACSRIPRWWSVSGLFRWSSLALFGNASHLLKCGTKVCLSALQFWWWKDDKDQLIQRYVPAFMDIQSLARHRFIRRKAYSNPIESSPATNYTLSPNEEDRLCGFHSIENFQDESFRWTEAVAHLQVDLPPGDYSFTIRTGAIRSNLQQSLQDLYFNEKRLTGYRVDSTDESITGAISAGDFETGSQQFLGMVCRPMPRSLGHRERRTLGLPVVEVAFKPV